MFEIRFFKVRKCLIIGKLVDRRDGFFRNLDKSGRKKFHFPENLALGIPRMPLGNCGVAIFKLIPFFKENIS